MTRRNEYWHKTIAHDDAKLDVLLVEADEQGWDLVTIAVIGGGYADGSRKLKCVFRRPLSGGVSQPVSQ